MHRLRIIALMAAIFVALAAPAARAGSVMQINGGKAYLFGSEVHPISEHTVTIRENGLAGSSATLVNPLLLILGIPLPPAHSASSPTPNRPAELATHSGGVFNAWEVYCFLGLNGGNNSESLSSWWQAELTVNGLTATSFGVFMDELTNTGVTGVRAISTTFSSGLPLGTFVAAYDRDGYGKQFDTPSTESDPYDRSVNSWNLVHEATSILLRVGVALAGLGR